MVHGVMVVHALKMTLARSVTLYTVDVCNEELLEKQCCLKLPDSIVSFTASTAHCVPLFHCNAICV